MDRKNAFLVYLVISVLLIGLLGNNPALELDLVSAQPDDGINGYQELHEDWVVTGYEEYTDEIIALFGDLTIEKNGHLVLNSCTLMMMSMILAPYEITVKAGGTLELYGCNITDPPDDDDSQFLSAYYYLIAKADSTLIIENCVVRQCGFIDMTNPEHMGLHVGTNSGHILNTKINSSIVALSFLGYNKGFLVENVELSEIAMSPLLMENTNGVRINNISFQSVGENNLLSSQNSHDFIVENVTLTGEQVLNFYASSDFSVKNIHGVDSERILRFEECNNFIVQNAVIASSFQFNTKIDIDKCSGFEIDSVQTANDNNLLKIDDSSYGTVSNIQGTNITMALEIWRSENIDIKDVNINKGSDLIRFWDCSGIFMDNIILDDVVSPIYINASYNSSISNLNIQKLEGIGVNVVFGSKNVSFSKTYIESESMEHTRGLWVDSSIVNVWEYSTFNVNLSIDCYKSNITGGNILVDGTYEPYSGIEIRFAGEVDLSDIQVLNPKYYGIVFEDCQEVDARLSNVYVNDSNAGLDFTRSNAVLSDLTFVNCVQDIQTWDNSYLTVMNSTINKYRLVDSQIVAIDAVNASSCLMFGSSSLTWKWWVDFYVIDSKGIVAGAKIEVRDNIASIEVESVTGPDGYAWDVPVIDTIFTTGPVEESKNPHTARAYELGWEGFSPSFSATSNMQVDINYFGNTPPNQPTNLKINPLENSSTILTWDASTSQDVVRYEIYIATDPTNLTNYIILGIPNATSTTTSYIHVSGSEDWQRYHYAVKSNDSQYDSERYVKDSCGDWVVNITSPQVINDMNITLFGTLWIYGNLTLTNTFFQFDQSSTDIFGIFINQSGSFSCENVTISRKSEEPYFFYIDEDANVVLNGSRIHYPGDVITQTEGYMKGIVSNSRNLTVKNCIIDVRLWGIGIHGAQNFMGVLDNITFYSHPWERADRMLDLDEVSKIKITQLKIYASTSFGVYASSVSSLDISLSNISMQSSGYETTFGIFLKQCMDSKIHNNTLILGNPGIFVFDSNNTIIENSNMSSWEQSAIQAQESMFTTIQQCSFVRTNGRVDDAVSLSGCTYSLVRDIVGGDNSRLIKMENESHSGIENVSLMGGEVGIWLINCEGLYLGNISMELLQTGIKMTGCRDMTMFRVVINLTINCFVMESPGPVYARNCSFSNGISGEVIAKGYKGNLGNLIMDNSSVSAFGDNTMILNDSAVVYLLNTSINISKLKIEDSGSRVELFHYLSLQVYDIDNSIPSYANITIMNSKEVKIYDETVALGKAQWILVHEKTIFRGNEFTDNPFSIYIDDGLHMGEQVAIINCSQHLDVTVSNLLPQITFIDILGYYDNPVPEPDYTHQPTTKYNIVLNYTYDDPENDPESGTTIHWYINGIYNSTFDNLSTVDSHYTQKGQIWQAIIYPSDGYNETYPKYPFESNILPIFNTPPSVSNVTIIPSNPAGGDNLYVNFEVYDLDDDGLDQSKTTSRWYIYNPISGDWEYSTIDSFYLPSLYTFKGHRWKCIVTPHDGDNQGLSVESQEVVIGNTPPSIQNARITSLLGSAIINGADNLRVQYMFLDADTDSEDGTAYEWEYQRAGGMWTAVSVNSSILPYSYTQRGDLWRCKVTPKDGEDFGSTVQTEVVEIYNTPPLVTNVTITPSYATSSDSLKVSYDYYDYDGDLENGTSYRWVYEDALGSKNSGIQGNVTPVGVLVRDHVWYCFVIPSDGLNVGLERGSSGLLIHNSPAAISSAAIQVISTETERHLWLSFAATDNDLDSVESIEIRWYKNNASQAQFDDNQTVAENYLVKGDLWHAQIRTYDGLNWSNWFTTDQIEIPNVAPSLLSIPALSPSKAKSDEDLVPDFESLFEDGDGDSFGGYEIWWYRDNGHMEDYDDLPIISKDLTTKGEIWFYKVRVSDGEDFSEWYSSKTSVIENSAPSNVTTSKIDSQITFNETETMEFQVSAEDSDGDPLSFRWTLDGRIVLLEERVSNSIYLLKTGYDSEGEYILRLVISDGEDTNETTWNLVIDKKNRLPEIKVVEPEGKTASIKEKETLDFAITKSDADSDNLQVEWFVDGVSVFEGSDKYSFTPDYSSSRNRVVQVVVSETESGANSTFSWDVSVADVVEGKEELLGMSYDAWGLILAVISGLAAILLFLFGFVRVRKKKGRLKEHMVEMDKILSEDEDPDVIEDKLVDFESQIRQEFSEGKLEDLHFLMLNEIIASRKGEVRKAEVTQKFGRLPKGVLKDLDKMLEDGNISKQEYEDFVTTISKSESLSPAQKKELSLMIGEWEAKDIDEEEEERPKKKEKLKKEDEENEPPPPPPPEEPKNEDDEKIKELISSLNGEEK